MAKKSLKQNKKNVGYKVIPNYSYRGTVCENAQQLEEVLQIDFEKKTGTRQLQICGDMRVLLRHLEEGHVVYINELSVPSSQANKQPSPCIVIRTVMNNQEFDWIISHDTGKSYSWEVNCSCEKSVFGAFSVYSSDKVAFAKRLL